MKRSNRWIVENYTSYNSIVHYQDSTYLAMNALLSIYNPYRQPVDIVAKNGENFAYQIIVEAKHEKARVIIHRFVDKETNDITYSRTAEMADIDAAKMSKENKNTVRKIFNQKHRELEGHAKKIFDGFGEALLAPVEMW